MYNGKREGVFWMVWLGVMLLLVFCLDLPGQVTLSATLDPIETKTPTLEAGGTVPLITVSLVDNPGVQVPVYNARLPINQPVRFHVSSFPEGVKGVHYSLQSVGGSITSTVPNKKQQFTPPSTTSDPFVPTVLGLDAVVIWYPHQNDPNPIESANQLMATQQRLPFVVVEGVDPTIPNGVTRLNNTFTAICSGWRFATTLDLTLSPVTFGIKDLLCIYNVVPNGTNVSCSKRNTDGEPIQCFDPVTILVP